MKSIWEVLNRGDHANRPRPTDDADLAAAVAKGDVTAVLRLLPRIGHTVNREYPPCGTLLMAAAFHGHTAVVKALLSHPYIDVNRRAFGWTALWAAARNDHAEVLALIIDHPGANVAIAFCGFTALHHAAIGGAVRAAGVLLRAHARGVDAGAPDRDGCTPLLCAASGPKAAFVSLLLRQPGLDFYQTNRYGVSVLQIASGRSRVGNRDDKDEAGRSIKTFAVLLRHLRTQLVVDQQNKQHKSKKGKTCEPISNTISILSTSYSSGHKTAAVYKFHGSSSRERELARRPGRGKWVPQQEGRRERQPAVVHIAVVPPRRQRWATPPDQWLIRSKAQRTTNFAWA